MIHWLQRLAIPKICGGISAMIGLLGLLGWVFDNAVMKSISPSWIAMLPNSAVCIVASGIALVFAAGKNRSSLLMSRALAYFVFAIAALSGAEYIFHINFHIDELLFTNAVRSTGVAYPGRMAPLTSAILILLGIALFLPPRNRQFIFFAQWTVAVAAFISTQVLLGYLYKTEEFYAARAITRTALHTAVATVILSLGTFLLHPTVGLAAFVTGDSLGSRLLRRLWLLTLSFLFFFGWLKNKGDELDWFGSGFGTGLLVMATSILFTLLIWRNARQLDSIESKRNRAEDSLRGNERQLQGILKSVTVGIGQTDLSGKYIFANDGFCRIVGRPRNELLQLTVEEITHPDDRSNILDLNRQLAAGGKNFVTEKRYLRPDGSVIWAQVDASLLRDDCGAPKALVAVISDITDRKFAESTVQMQQNELSDFFEHAPFGLEWLSTKGVILRANQTELAMLGYEPDEFVGHNFSEFFNNPNLGGDFIQRSRTEALRDYEAQLRGKDGNVRHVLINSVLRRENGNALQIRCSLQDITDRRQAEQQLRTRTLQQEALAKLGNYAATGPDLGVFMDFAASFVAQTLQVEFCKILKLRPDKSEFVLEAGVGWKEGCVGRATVPNDTNSQAGYTLLVDKPVSVSDLRTEERFRAPQLLLEHGVLSGMSATIPGDEGMPFGILGAHSKELRTFNRDDLNFLQATANLIGYAIHSEHERILRKRATELTGYSAQLEQSVAKRTAELQKSVDFLEKFLYAMAHDLRAPIRAMSGFTMALEEDYSDRLDETGKTYTQRIKEAAIRMDRIVSDLLDFGRLTHVSFSKEPIDLDPALDGVLRELAPEIVEKKAVIEIRKPLGIILGNKEMLWQLLSNLISNSLKFVARDVVPQIAISSRVDLQTKMVKVSIKDNGIGIDPRYHQKIFGPFERLHSSEYPGTGMGLAIAQKVVDRLGGRIGFDSEGGHGTHFWFELPLAEKPTL